MDRNEKNSKNKIDLEYFVHILSKTMSQVKYFYENRLKFSYFFQKYSPSTSMISQDLLKFSLKY